MSKTSHLSPILLITVFLLVVGCSGPGEIHEWKPESIEFSLEGPLFEGPNTGQVLLPLDFSEFLGDDSEKKISAARLMSAQVHAGDSLGFQQVRSFVLSFASDNEDVAMQEAAFKNPLPSEVSSVALDVAATADLGELFAEDRVYVVLDVDLMEDFWDGNRAFLLDLRMETKFK